MIIKRTLVACAAMLTASACTPNDIGLGDTVKSNYAAQIVNAEPVYEDSLVADGSQAAAGQERYRKGTVRKPVGVKTTTGGIGSSSN